MGVAATTHLELSGFHGSGDLENDALWPLEPSARPQARRAALHRADWICSAAGKVIQVRPMALDKPVVMLNAFRRRKPGGGAV